MLAKKIEQIVPQTSTVVRRIFRVGQDFVCGICRVKHKHVEKANKCLEKCWRIIQFGTPFIAFKRLGKIEFACVYCMRAYANVSEAKACAEDCVSHLNLTSMPEQPEQDHKPAPKKTTPKPIAKPTPIVDLNTQKPRSEESIAVKNVATAAPKLVVTKPVELEEIEPETISVSSSKKSTEEDEAEKAEKAARDRTVRFERQGSKYVCVKCKSKFFTREDVEACYNAHES